MIPAREGKDASSGEHHPPPRPRRKVHIEMALRSGAVAKHIAIGPHDAVANSKVRRDWAKHELVHNDDRRVSDRLRRCRGGGKRNCHYGRGKDESLVHFRAATSCSAWA